MANYVYDANTRLDWYDADGIANISAPTTGELNAPDASLSCLLTKDGWQPSTNTNSVSNAKLCQRFDSTTPGTYGGEATGKFLRDNEPGQDIAWDKFRLDLEGFIVVRYGLPHDQAYANGQEVEVYPVICNSKNMDQTATNQNAAFTQVFNVHLEPDQHAVVGGGS